jgi:hypothetical protein
MIESVVLIPVSLDSGSHLETFMTRLVYKDEKLTGQIECFGNVWSSEFTWDDAAQRWIHFGVRLPEYSIVSECLTIAVMESQINDKGLTIEVPVSV